MRNLILSLILLFSFGILQAQDEEGYIVNDVKEGYAWDIVRKAFTEQKLRFYKQAGNPPKALSSYFEYSTVLTKNRAKVEVRFENDRLVLDLVERQYMSDEGWVDNILPLGKKSAEKYLGPLQQRLTELNQPRLEEYRIKEMKASIKGNFKDVILVQTGKPDMQVAAIHRNGSMIGYSLSPAYDKMLSLSYLSSPEESPLTVSFDESGRPGSAGYKDLVFLFRYDPEGIGYFIMGAAEELEYVTDTAIHVASPAADRVRQDAESDHGPLPPLPLYVDASAVLSTLLDNSGTIVKTVMCGSAILSAGATLPMAIAPCGSLLFDVLARTLPENDIVGPEALAMMSSAFSLASFSNPVATLEKLDVAIDGMRNARDAFGNLQDKYFPEDPELRIEGPETLKQETFGEIGYVEKLTAYSAFTDVDVQWSSSSDAVLLYHQAEGSTGYSPHHFSVTVYANPKLAAGDGKEAAALIIAKQVKDGREYKASHLISVEVGNYYYFPDCDKLHKQGVITDAELEACLDDADRCMEILPENDVVLETDPRIIEAILKEHLLSASGLVDPTTQLNSEKLNMVRKLWKEDGTPYPPEEAGELREFVTCAPCMMRWESFGDFKEIIRISYEGMEKLEAIEKKIEGLQKVANASNYEKIAAQVQELEDSQQPLRDSYAERLNAIASKGTIRYPATKEDKNAFYSPKGATIVGAEWRKGASQPSFNMDVFYTPRETIKTVESFGNVYKFKEHLRQFSFAFQDPKGEEITKYALLFSEDTWNKGVVRTNIRLNIFEKEVSNLHFTYSTAWTTKIE